MSRSIPRRSIAGLRLVAIDGSNFELPDEADNDAAFGHPGSRTGRMPATRRPSAWCWSSAPRTPSWGPTSGPTAPASGRCASRCCRACAGHAVHGRPGLQRLRALAPGPAPPARSCCGAARQPALPVQRQLRRRLLPQRHRAHRRAEARPGRRAGHHGARHRVRAARPGRRAAALPAADDAAGPAAAPAMELAALYHQRWEIEAVFDELKTHLRAEPPGAAQQDAGAGAPGVLRLGAGALRRALAAAPGGHPTPNAARRVVLHRPRPAAAPRTAPSGAFPPRAGRGCASAASSWCSKPAPACEPTRHATAVATHGQAPKLAVRIARPNGPDPSADRLHAADIAREARGCGNAESHGQNQEAVVAWASRKWISHLN